VGKKEKVQLWKRVFEGAPSYRNQTESIQKRDSADERLIGNEKFTSLSFNSKVVRKDRYRTIDRECCKAVLSK